MSLPHRIFYPHLSLPHRIFYPHLSLPHRIFCPHMSLPHRISILICLYHIEYSILICLYHKEYYTYSVLTCLYHIGDFLLGFLTHFSYNYSIENWVCPCWGSLAGTRTWASVVAACNLTFILSVFTCLCQIEYSILTCHYHIL